MLQVIEATAAISHTRPSPTAVAIPVVNARLSSVMDDRKRSAASDYDDGHLPPAKRHASASLINGDDQQQQQHQQQNQLEGSNVKFGPAGSPWQVDLEVCYHVFRSI
jgi:hypothetical protein